MRALTLLFCSLVGCADSVGGLEEAELLLEVRDDAGLALGNIPILLDGVRVATSDGQGRATAILQAKRGQRLRVKPSCPSDYREPESRMVRLAPESVPPVPLTLRLVCVPKLRTLAVVVRAPGAQGLALRADGQPTASVDAAGLAHVLLQRPPDSVLRLSLDTTPAPQLLPQFPVREVQVADHDEIVVFDQPFSRFSLPKAPAPRRRSSTQGGIKHVPYAIGRSD